MKSTPKELAKARRYRATAKGKDADKRFRNTPARKEYMRRHGRSPTRLASKARYKAEKRRTERAMIHALKSVPCMDCGGSFDPVCMDFDHRPGEVKSFTIGTAIHKFTAEQIRAEIEKCDVVCANCHRLRTYRQRNHRNHRDARGPSKSTPQLGLFVEGAAITVTEAEA